MTLKSFENLERLLRSAAAEYERRCLDEEQKANFNPNQPRVPRGNPRGGEWTGAGKPSSGDGAKEIGRIWRGWESDIDWEQMELEARRHSRQVQQFVARNRASITRVLGALQIAGATGEMVLGVAGVAGGVATSETGVGIAIAAASAWMVTNGYDNFAAGWRALTTGNPQETNLHTALRNLGLSEDHATATEVLLAGGASAVPARLTRPALLEAAQAGLSRRTVEMLAAEPLNVRAGALRVWDEVNIMARGESWEAFDAQRTGFLRTPATFRVFDQVNESFEIAISNKTLDLAQLSYSRSDRSAVYNTLAGYIDRAAAFEHGAVGNFIVDGARLRERRLHMLFPAGEVLPGQSLQIAAAEQYAMQRGVVLQVEYAR